MKRLQIVVLLLLVSVGLTACGLSEAETKYNSATEKLNKQDMDGALADFNEAIRLDPNLAIAYMNRGVIYASKGEFDKAIGDETKAIELKPEKTEDQATAYSNRGTAYLAKGDLDKALADVEEAIKIKSDNAKAYLLRGSVHSGKGDTEGAITDFKKVIELSKDSAEGQAAQKLLDQLQPTP